MTTDAAMPMPAWEAIAYHGWGFDRQCWQPWQAKFATLNIPLKACDRGYFGNPTQPSFDYPHSKKIILAHSYGLHRCPPQQLRIADLIIVFGGFARFHPRGQREERRSRRTLQQMIQQFDQNPTAVLRAFWQNCGLAADRYAGTHPSPQPLAHDLADLDHSLLCVDFLARRPQVLLLHGRQDRIVPLSQGQALAAALAHSLARPISPGSPQTVWFELEGPHGLPFTHLQDCWGAIAPYLNLPNL